MSFKFNTSSKKWVTWLPYLLVILTAWVAINTSFNKDYKNGKLEADARGYYAYLPAVFIYHDLGFKFINKIEFDTYKNPKKYYKYYNIHQGKVFNKYYAGTALLLSPFFMLGHAITLVTQLPADGYSYYYTALVHIGALFYLLIGLLGLRKLLRAFGFSESIVGWTLVLTLLATNLFYYVITEFAMSHIYSFTAIVWFCWSIQAYFKQPGKGLYILLSSVLLAIIVLIRPVNIIIILAIPFFVDSYKNLHSGFRMMFTQTKWLVLSLLAFILLVSIQFIIYKIGVGSFYLFSYKGERFDFLHPNMLKFLFSYKKGFFVYTPLMLVSLVGLIFYYRNNKYLFLSVFVFLFLLVYVLSSWEMWYYGGSFSQRVMIDFYAVFAILLANALQNINAKRFKKWVYIVLVLLLFVNQVQTYQYRRAIIHWSEMTKARYWEVFMRIDKLM